MTPAQVDRILDGLKGLADKLGQGAEAMWHLYYRQAQIQGIKDALWAVMFLVAAIVGWRLLWPKARGLDAHDIDRHFAMGALGIATAIFVLSAFGFASSAVSHLLNPGYYAL